MQQHPGRPEPDPQHGKPIGERRLLHLHEHLAALRQQPSGQSNATLLAEAQDSLCAS